MPNAIVDSVTGQHHASENPTTPVAQPIGRDGLDANALLNSLAQGQTQGQPEGALGANADSLVSDILKGVGGQPNPQGINQILQGLENQQGPGSGVEIIQVKETIVQQINGPGAVRETVIESAQKPATRSANEAQPTAATNTTVSGGNIWRPPF